MLHFSVADQQCYLHVTTPAEYGEQRGVPSGITMHRCILLLDTAMQHSPNAAFNLT